jgi:NAD(P)-dependent dehydrogenase (short-subunit alcohol dehydrogenase family)
MIKKVAKSVNPRQVQNRPGSEAKMHPQPVADDGLEFTGKLKDKVVLITGGDSGIGRAVSVLFARQGAHIAIVYLSESRDANDTKEIVEGYGRQCLLIKGNIRKEEFCKSAVNKTLKQFRKLDILINNAAIHYEAKNVADIVMSQMRETFEVNIFSMFYLVKHSLPFLKKGAIIINTSSVTAYRGSAELIDYAATKGAIVSYTRSLAANLIKRGIRVNGVAPGPIWTPLIVSSFSKKKVSEHGSKVPMERPGEPAEVAPAYLFLACDDSSYITGQFIHPNGGEIVNA